MLLSKIINSNFASIVFDNTNYSISKSNSNFKKALKALANEDYTKFMILCNPVKALPTYFSTDSGQVTLDCNTLYYNGEKVDSSIVSTVLEHVNKRINPKYLLNFLEKLYKNPSKRAISESYDFFSSLGLTITDSGNVLAYRSVRPTFMDWQTNTVDNSPGKEPSMPRNSVDDDPTRTCSNGYHAGTFEYASTFHSSEPHRIILIDFSPEDIVSIPKEQSAQKARICKYKVLSVYGESEKITSSVQHSNRDSSGKFVKKN